MRYIIKNCPMCEDFCEVVKSYECQNVENCLLKQIVEKCKNYKESCEIEGNCLDKRLCSTCFLGGANELGEWILDDLEIEECEDG